MTPSSTTAPAPLTMWHGMGLPNWLRLLRQRPPVDRAGRTRMLKLTATSLGNSALNLVERLLWRRRSNRVTLHPEPVFILGHWRSGTTLLHNLLALDPRLAYVNYYQAAFPGHFLISQSWLPGWLNRRLPPQRPMDNMPLAWDLLAEYPRPRGGKVVRLYRVALAGEGGPP